MASLLEVARASGVSIATVSRAIAKPGKLAPDTLARVRLAMTSLGYKPNRAAQRLRRPAPRHQLFGLIIHDVQNPYYAEIARGVEDAAYERDIMVFLCNSDEDPAKQARCLELMRAEFVDGVILPPIPTGADAIRQACAQGYPIVGIDRLLPDAEFDQVLVDSRGGGFEATGHLLDQGHRRIAFIGGPQSVSTAQERYQGYEDALTARGLPVNPDLIRTGDNKPASGRALALELLGEREPPTAIFVSNNLMAVGALQGIRASGRRVPADVALICFDDFPWAESLDPPMSVVCQPAYRMGQTAAKLLLERLENPLKANVIHRLEPSLRIRQSTVV